MARKGKSKKSLDEQLEGIPADRAGLPAKDSIRSVEKLVTPDNQEFTIMHTDERDAYDPPPRPKRQRRKT